VMRRSRVQISEEAHKKINDPNRNSISVAGSKKANSINRIATVGSKFTRFPKMKFK
jgi:hypothetical protein